MVESHSPEHLRLFVALAVPVQVQEQIKTVQDQLRRGLERGAARWTRPDQFHLTLRFLGTIEAGLVGSLVDVLRTVCQSTRPLQLRAVGVGFFPNARAPRVVWIGVQDSQERLGALQKSVQQATLRFTAEKPEERFSGHITLGRIKHLSRQETETMARTAERFSETLFGGWSAHELHVMRSQLSAEGADHRLLAAVPLS